jgi:hypothetical protein
MEAVPHMRKLVLAGAIATVAALGTTAPAYGGGCSKDPPSSVAQYVEQVPCPSGSQATGTGTKKRTVPKQIQTKIEKQGGSDAKTLETIVSSESAGAPQTPIKTHPAKAKKHKTKTHVKQDQGSSKIISDSETRKSNPLAASVGVITDGSDSRLIVLIVLMVAVAGVVIVSALRRRRVTR